MLSTWEEFDELVDQGLAESNVKNGMLKTQLTVLLVKNLISYQTSVGEIQQILKGRYDVEYKPSQIEDELLVMQWEEQVERQGNDIVELEEDFFEGF